MKRTIWALFDNRMGSVGQAKGVLQALDGNYTIVEKNINYNCLSALPNCLKGASLIGLTSDSKKDLSAPFPEVVLSISRRTTPAARWIKKKSGGQTKIIQLMYPGHCGLQDLDLVILPKHDRLHKTAGQAEYITGCPHRVTPQTLEEAAIRWEKKFSEFPRPWTTVIIGGAIKGKPFSRDNAKKLGEEIKKLIEQTGGSLLITSSRRTGAEAEAVIKEQITGIPAFTYWWGEKKDNPLMGFLALGDRIIVTGDSVSMCCESCGSGKPVLVFCGEKWLTPKHHRFVQSLYAGNYATALEDENALAFQPQQRLDPSAEVASFINKLFD